MTKQILIVALAILPTFAVAMTHEEVFQAAKEGRWDDVRNAVIADPTVVNYTPSEGPDRGTTVFWGAACTDEWDLVETMLQNNPKANVDAAPAEGPDRTTVLWHAAGDHQWDLVRTMLKNNPTANIDATHAEGPDQGKTVLWWAAANSQWDVVRTMLQNNPTANIEAAPAEDLEKGITVFDLAQRAKQWDVLSLMLDGDPSVLAQRAAYILGIVTLDDLPADLVMKACATFLAHASGPLSHKGLLSFKPHLANPRYIKKMKTLVTRLEQITSFCWDPWPSTDPKDNTFLLSKDHIVPDVQVLFAIWTLVAEHPELAPLPEGLLKQLLEKARLKILQTKSIQLGAITAQKATQRRFPVPLRTPNVLNSETSTANIKAIESIIAIAIKRLFNPSIYSLSEALDFGERASHALGSIKQLTEESINEAIASALPNAAQNPNKRGSDQENSAAKRQQTFFSGAQMQPRFGSRANVNTITNFLEQDLPSDGDCAFHGLGISRVNAVRLLLDNSNVESLRRIVAAEIRTALIAGELPATMNTPEVLDMRAYHDELAQAHNQYACLERLALDERILAWAMQESTYRTFVTAFLGRGAWLTYLPTQQGLMNAIAALANIHVTIWTPNPFNPRQINQIYEAGPAGATRRVDLLHTNGLTHFTLLTETQPATPMSIDTPHVPLVATFSPPRPVLRLSTPQAVPALVSASSLLRMLAPAANSGAGGW